MHLITTTHALSDLCDRLGEHPFVTVDTEFIREQTFWPKLCLLQLAGPGGDEAVVDPLAPGLDLAPFYKLMANERVVKVFHAARQDLEIVWTQARLMPKPIFDTQVAAMVCGFGESVSYVNLVKQTTGKNLDKSSRFTDWARRPLSERQLEYALGDVTYLRDVYLHLKKKHDPVLHLARTVAGAGRRRPRCGLWRRTPHAAVLHQEVAEGGPYSRRNRSDPKRLRCWQRCSDTLSARVVGQIPIGG
jgi:ribonuclease D